MTEASDPPAPRTLEGVVERIVFASEASGWCVVRLRPGGGTEVVTAVGSLLGIRPGETVRLSGRWVDDPRYGRQFEAESFLSILPSTKGGIERYLGSGLVPGIGKVMARRLVTRFGVGTLDVIENHPERLTEVAGIGRARSSGIRQAWQKQREIRDVMIFLQAHGVSTAHASKIFQRYGKRAVAELRKNPYRLASEIAGLGFLSADRIAARLGVPPESVERAGAGLLFALQQAAEGGHTFLPRQRLLDRTAALLDVPVEVVNRGFEDCRQAGALVEEAVRGSPVFLPSLYEAEAGLARRLQELLVSRRPPLVPNLEQALASLEAHDHLTLSDPQREAIRAALTAPLLVITGGPGTGKTTLVRGVVEILHRGRVPVALAAPTGRAAKRLAEATATEARTLHRLLEFDPKAGRFQRCRERPLEARVVIVDEASMLDTTLAHALCDALPDGGRLVFVGDADQLPSVGPGKVLDDLIASGRFPVVRLSRIFRQRRASHIVLNAHRVLQGQEPDLTAVRKDGDFFFIEREAPEEVRDTILHLVGQRIPDGFGLDPHRDVQVLTPMRRGLLGSVQLNQALQELLNPRGRAVTPGGPGLRLGDRVMQIRNNYELDVFNGDIGHVVDADEEDGSLVIRLDERRIVYRRNQLDQLVLAYACSVHKAQGSEYPCVVLPLHTQHTVMLQRNLLYTAITRARRLLVIVGSRRALQLAVHNSRPQRRYTRLADRLAATGG